MGLMLLASVLGAPARACDVCGCSASSNSLGILPKATFNFIGIQYLYNGFSSDHPSLFENRPNEQAKDYYNTLQVWGRYNVGSRLQLFAFLPYRYNQQRGDTGTVTMSGIGDISFLANVILIKDDPARSGWQSQLLAGGGLKLPTGSYTGITQRDKEGLPNMQPGTGSWDFILNTNYTLRRRNNGLNLDASYTITLPNSESYKYGNRLGAGLLAFHSFTHRDVTLTPQAGIRYEYSLHDYDNYERRWLNKQSGGYLCFAAAGMQAYYKRLGLRVVWQLPLSQDYATGYVTATNKIDAGLFLLF